LESILTQKITCSNISDFRRVSSLLQVLDFLINICDDPEVNIVEKHKVSLELFNKEKIPRCFLDIVKSVFPNEKLLKWPKISTKKQVKNIFFAINPQKTCIL